MVQATTPSRVARLPTTPPTVLVDRMGQLILGEPRFFSATPAECVLGEVGIKVVIIYIYIFKTSNMM